MRWFRFAVFIVVVTVLQAGLLNIIAVTHLNIKPDLLLILMVFFAIYCNSTEAIITSFAIGFAADIISSTMGPQIISFGLFGTLLAYLHQVIAIRKTFHQSITIFLMVVLNAAFVHFLTFLKGQPTAPNAYAVVFGTSIYSAVVGPFLFLPHTWLMRIKKPKR